MQDLREFDRQAVLASVAVADQLGPDDLQRTTPCAGWTVADLIAHLIAQHRGFTAACAGSADPSAWAVRPSGPDPAAAYTRASAAVIAAFAEPDVLERQFWLPEISSTTSFPAAQAISFHFVDYVVHGWDLAKALDVPFELAPDLLTAALAVAARVPGGVARLAPGSAFGPALDAVGDAAPLERIVAMLGRSPRWPQVLTVTPCAERRERGAVGSAPAPRPRPPTQVSS